MPEIRGETNSKCCGKFSANMEVSLNPDGYAERYALFGICPRCNNPVLEIHKRTFKGEWFCETLKRKKAIRLYNQIQKEIISELIPGKIPKGTKSRMGFRYGENRQRRDGTIDRYAVDWNGTKELLH